MNIEKQSIESPPNVIKILNSTLEIYFYCDTGRDTLT